MHVVQRGFTYLARLYHTSILGELSPILISRANWDRGVCLMQQV